MTADLPAGFVAAAVDAGIKSRDAGINSRDLDLAVVAAADVVPAAATFTRNRAAAAPVVLSRHHLRGHAARAVVLNSGCANAGTSKRGEEDALDVASGAAEALGCRPEHVLVCSTGPIGTYLPMDTTLPAVTRAVESLAATPAGLEAAATAIMTTDSVPKLATSPGSGYVITGFAKGAGMVRPDMATLLVTLLTDAVMTWQGLERSLRAAVTASFNSLNLDGCASTNDTVVAMASGGSGTRPDPEEFDQVLTAVCVDLARQIARDAEGGSRVVTLHIVGAENDSVARAVGRAIADSALVRASFHGGDPNWGRILAAVGAGAFPVNTTRVAVSYAGVEVARDGAPVDHDTEALRSRLSGDFAVTVEFGSGPGAADVLTVDLTPDYVNFNAEYS